MQELFSFPDTMSKTFEMLETQRSRLAEEMNAGLAPKGGPNEKHIQMLEKLAVTMTKLGAEMRQWSGHQKSSFDKMSPVKKAQIIVQFIQDSMPLGPRRDLYNVLANLEAKRPDGIPLTVRTTPTQDADR